MPTLLIRDREEWQEVTRAMIQAEEVAVRPYLTTLGDLISYSASWGPPGEVQAVYVPLQL